MGNHFDVAGRVVIVTGGTRGVGAGITRAFLEAGATVLMWARRPPDAPVRFGDGPAASHVPVDLRDEAAVEAAITACVAEHGRLDVLVNNAGGSPPADSSTASAKFTRAIIDLNLVIPILCAQQANSVMQRQSTGGAIVNIASVSGVRPSPTTAAYGAAKAGLVNATQTLAQEWAPRVRVNAVVVGLVRTEQAHLFYGDDAGIAAVGATVPAGRLAEPEDVGRACVYLASPAAGYVSGAALAVHGGGERPPYLDAAH